MSVRYANFLRNGVRLDTADRMTFMELWGGFSPVRLCDFDYPPDTDCVGMLCVLRSARLGLNKHIKGNKEGWSTMCDMDASERLYLR